MGYCVALDCKNGSGMDLAMFRFPLEPHRKTLRAAWIANVGREESWQPSKHSRLCQVHFTEDSFTKNPALAKQSGCRLLLKEDAVPTLKLRPRTLATRRGPARAKRPNSQILAELVAAEETDSADSDTSSDQESSAPFQPPSRSCDCAAQHQPAAAPAGCQTSRHVCTRTRGIQCNLLLPRPVPGPASRRSVLTQTQDIHLYAPSFRNQDLPHQHVCYEKFLTGQQLCNQERSFSLVQGEPEPPQIAEEQEEQQLGLKEETDAYMVTAAYEDSDLGPNRDQLLSHSSDTFMFVQSQSKETLEVVNNSVQYEDGADHERRQVDITRMPIIKLYRMDCPQQDVCKEDLLDRQLCNQETNSSLDQEEAKPPQIKEEHEELCLSQEGEQLPLKEETHTFMVIATYEESEAEPNRDQLLSHSSPVAENQDQEGSKNVDSRSTRKCRNHSNSPEETLMSERQSTTDTSKKALKWDVCGTKKLQMNGQTSHTCEICRKCFTKRSTLTVHMRTHTGERPHRCNMCDKMFTSRSGLSYHMKTHRPCHCGKM